MFRKTIVFYFFLFLGIVFAGTAKAVCPLCVVAVGTGLGFSRWLGIDDIISSIWIGALLSSMSIWTIIWLDKKKWNFKFYKIIIPAVYYLSVSVLLYYSDIIGHPLNQIWGIDKIIFGTILGTAIFLASIWLHNFLKIKNNGKQFFNYQKVLLPFLVLTIISLILWKII